MATLTIPNTFVDATPAEAADVNQNFDAVATFVNNEVVNRDGSIPFTAVPSGPASDPSSSNQLARKSYLDATAAASVDARHGGTWSRVANQTVVSGATGTLTLDTETADTDGYWSSGTTITIPTGLGGTYVVTGKILGSVITGQHVRLNVAGTTFFGPVSSSITGGASAISVVAALADAATITLGAGNSSGSDSSVTGIIHVYRASL